MSLMPGVENERVRVASQRTLQATGVRMSAIVFNDLEPEEGWVRVDGVADLAGARVSVRDTFGPTPAFDASLELLGSKLAERFPWLGINTEQDSDAPPIESGSIYIGLRHFACFGERWAECPGVDDIPASATRLLSDPTRILEHLQGVQGAKLLGQQTVRDVACDRYAATVEAPASWRKRRRQRSEQLYVEVWIDSDGLIRKVISSPTSGTRSRPGALLRGAAYVERRKSGEVMDLQPRAEVRLWHCLELWDFGIDLDIEPPENVDTSNVRVRDLVGDAIGLWRRRRRWKAQQTR
jgi:hypothetical protein